MAGKHGAASLSPGQSQYVLERLLAERRIAPAEVSQYLREIHDEISTLEKRLLELRAAAGQPAVANRTASTAPPRGVGRRPTSVPRPRKRKGNRLAGSYMGYMRQVPARQKAKYQAIKQERGYEAAIAALKADLGK
jgi:hypothetical protein